MARLQFRSSLILKMRLKAFWLRSIESGRDPGIPLKPFILTGPPRSGTSLLSALLTRKSNVVVANEPVVVGDPLMARGQPAKLLRGYMNSIASQIVTRGTMPTKVDTRDPSRPTTDTAHRGSVRRDVPIAIQHDKPLCVGVKHPISFMEFLGELVEGWPELKVIVLVRDPVLTIRSWRETTYGWQPGLDDRVKGLWRRIYAQVPRDADPLAKRAHLWKLLVERGEQYRASHASQVMIQRYEDCSPTRQPPWPISLNTSALPSRPNRSTSPTSGLRSTRATKASPKRKSAQSRTFAMRRTDAHVAVPSLRHSRPAHR